VKKVENIGFQKIISTGHHSTLMFQDQPLQL